RGGRGGSHVRARAAALRDVVVAEGIEAVFAERIVETVANVPFVPRAIDVLRVVATHGLASRTTSGSYAASARSTRVDAAPPSRYTFDAAFVAFAAGIRSGSAS